MDVVQAMDHFNFIGDSHYSSAPSSPRGASEYCDFDELLLAAGASYSGEYKSVLAAVPFAWEEKPGVPKALGTMGALGLGDEDDFSFDVSCEVDSVSVPAEDLFAGGVIKTVGTETRGMERERGRERGFSSSRLSSSRSRRTRSLSPLGVSDYRREHQQLQQLRLKPSAATTTTPVCSSDNGSKRWSFRDLFLFRSASDGSVMEKYPLKKYFTNRKTDQDFKNSSESGSISKRKGRVSAHELHYNLNRANSNDLKKKTYLPYKQGILGGFSFNS